MTPKAATRNATIRSLTDQVGYFDMGNPVHRAHYLALAAEFGELAAIMLVSQDAARAAKAMDWPSDHNGVTGLELTDPGAIASHPGWKARNRVVRHGAHPRYTIINPDAETQVGGRVIPMFTRDQTVPAYAQD